VLSGIDVSHHQGSIDWRAVAGADMAFAWCKASEGVSFRDVRFTANWAGIREAGMVRGAYHFLRSDGDARVQARHFVGVVGDFSDSMAALDVESSGASRPTAAQARAFGDEFARLTNDHPLVVYTGRWYWVGVLGNPHGADLGPLWHSAYTSSPGPLYGGWDRFMFWQFTSSGRCPGVRGNVDINHFFGDRAALAELQEDDLPFTEDQLVTLMRRALQAELQTIGDPTRSAFYELARRAVADEFATIGTRTREALIALLAREIASPTGDLHGALLSVIEASESQ
jgi:lysozyme